MFLVWFRWLVWLWLWLDLTWLGLFSSLVALCENSPVPTHTQQIPTVKLTCESKEMYNFQKCASISPKGVYLFFSLACQMRNKITVNRIEFVFFYLSTLCTIYWAKSARSWFVPLVLWPNDSDTCCYIKEVKFLFLWPHKTIGLAFSLNN